MEETQAKYFDADWVRCLGAVLTFLGEIFT